MPGRSVTPTVKMALFVINTVAEINTYTGWPNENRTFLKYHIFAATSGFR